jgi:phosphatidylserine decarboxylase
MKGTILMLQHQYIERDSGRVATEALLGDSMVRLLYHQIRENSTGMFNLLTSSRSSQLLASVTFDRPLMHRRSFSQRCGIDLSECMDPPEVLDTARKIFERKIRYERCRPLPDDADAVVSPADARVVVGSLKETDLFFLKEKFFSFHELLGHERTDLHTAFNDGDFALFRLTPDKYHYNHTPVSGRVCEFYDIDGMYHSCNPTAVVSIATPYSKNKRVVTVIDTDVPGGSQVGLVAMVEVVALMIGDIVQAYSEHRYDDPQQIRVGMHLKKGQPKSLYRPGSSTDILIFQHGRIRFADDLLQNQVRNNVISRFSHGFGRPLVETDIKVRSLLATLVK